MERSRPLDLTPPWAAGQALDIDATGSTIVLLLDRRPPLMVSHDSGSVERARRRAARGAALALGESPDDPLRGPEPRLCIAGRAIFWRAVAVELPEIRDIAWA